VACKVVSSFGGESVAADAKNIIHAAKFCSLIDLLMSFFGKRLSSAGFASAKALNKNLFIRLRTSSPVSGEPQ
jgi:hypothetical protein